MKGLFENIIQDPRIGLREYKAGLKFKGDEELIPKGKRLLFLLSLSPL
jgi:hypothetical protein